VPRAIQSTPLISSLEVSLSQYQQSEFKQVNATFSTSQSKELVFRVLSTISQSKQWLQKVNHLEVLEVYNNHQYLLRTVINSPWPFKKRELITCVDTEFTENITSIYLSACSERMPVNELYVRLINATSSWTITQKNDALVEVAYKAWIDPAGHVPAFIFNRELMAATKSDLEKLQGMIENATLNQYAY